MYRNLYYHIHDELVYKRKIYHDENVQLSHDMRFPTMWHFDKCRLTGACAATF